MRIYDPRVGRFLSVDPIVRQYPNLTPYQYASNNPIQNIDIDGLEGMAQNTFSPGNWHIPGDANDDGHYTKTELRQGWKIMKFTGKLPLYTLTPYSISIPMLVSDISGVPVTPSPQAFATPIGPAMVESGSATTESGAIASTKTVANESNTIVREGKATVSASDATTLSKSTNESATEDATLQATTANNGNNPIRTRPTPIQSEKDLTPTGPGELNQPSFKSGNWVKNTVKGSVKPESFNFMTKTATEVKNFTFTPKGVNEGSIKTLVDQIISRRTHLPAGSVQNVIVDLRGQNVPASQQMHFKSTVLTQAGSQNVNIEFKTDK